MTRQQKFAELCGDFWRTANHGTINEFERAQRELASYVVKNERSITVASPSKKAKP
jgi:hypothetical protein